ncbi:MAG: DUF1223 domain-containing protein [Paracoccaceae bacterium]|jgi:hypothetical protein
MRSTLVTFAVAMQVLSGAAMAQSADHPAVIELYTSQGCSSCPPADALLAQMAARDDVIALALHVDYWDYIGWKDTFGNERFSARQKAYARAAGEHMVYTPQMIINGRASIVGADGADLAEVLAPAADSSAPDLSLTRSGGTLQIRATSVGPLPEGTVVQLVRYIPRADVAVDRGENAGRTITYTHVVMSWNVLGKWNGASPLSLNVPAEGDQPAVVLIQAPGPGPILAAAEVR